MPHPFPYFGQGSALADELSPLVVFVSEVPAAELARVAATAPAPVRDSIQTGPRWLQLKGSDHYLADARRWVRDANLSGARSDDKAFTAIAEALERWILELHQTHPVALFFVDSMEEGSSTSGAWHAWSIEHYGDLVRPVVARLRADGARDHASWIATNFLKFGAVPGAEDLRAMADDDGPATIGNINRRCISIMHLTRTQGDGVLAELGPYAELGYWACAAVPELVSDPARFPAHLAALAQACPGKHPDVLQQLLVDAATRLVADGFPLIVTLEHFPGRKARPRRELVAVALEIVAVAAALAPLTWPQVDALVSTVRSLGAERELARVVLASTLAAATPLTRPAILKWGRALLAQATARGDVEATAWLTAVPSLYLVPEVIELPVEGATHPHLARLNAARLEVSYRGSAEPQLVQVQIVGAPHPGRAPGYARAMANLVDLMNSGVAGGGRFAPELGEAEIVEGREQGDGPDFAWTLRLRAIDAGFVAVALHLLGDSWNPIGQAREVRYCPKHVRIVGELALDDSGDAVRTDDVLCALIDPSPAYRAWPELPFPVKEAKKAKTARFSLKLAAIDPERKAAFEQHVHMLGAMFDAHPQSGTGNRRGPTAVGKTQLGVPFAELTLPAELARGPLLNMARHFHVRVAPVSWVEVALGEPAAAVVVEGSGNEGEEPVTPPS